MVEIEIPDLSGVLEEALQDKIDAALSVADNDVRKLIVGKVIHDNTDANGQIMPIKKPKPAKSPKNHPEVPLVDTGNMLDKARWQVEHDTTSATVTYYPPDYYEYLIAKNRPWLTHDKLNDEVRKEIEALMVQKMLDQESQQAEAEGIMDSIITERGA